MKSGSIGIVGLGRMGSAMAERLLHEGWRVVGYDVDPRRVEGIEHEKFVGAVSPGDVAKECEQLLVSVFDGEQLTRLLSGEHGLLDDIRAQTLIIDTSTVDPKTSQECAQACAEVGARFLRSTVSGNPGVARSGQLGVFCSGLEEDYAAATPVLDDLAATHTFLGPGEASRYAKLSINLMVAGMNVLMAEALAIAEGAGISREAFLDCVQNSVVASRFTEYKGAAHLAHDYRPTMTPGDIRKDLGYVLEAARALGVGVPATATVDQTYAMAGEAGLADLDFGAVVLLHPASRDAWKAASTTGDDR